jgi:hypothetical protein
MVIVSKVACILNMFSYLCRIDLGIICSIAPVLHISRPRQRPHPKRVITTAGHDKRPLGPLFQRAVIHLDPLGLDHRKASHSTGMATKYMRAAARHQIPNPDGAVRRATDEGVLRRRQRPNTSLVPIELLKELARRGRVHMDGVVIGR